MIDLLVRSKLISEADAKELLAILENAPDKTVSDVLLETGVVTKRQLQSRQLAESLLNARDS